MKKYKRVLIKLSGEIFSREGGSCCDSRLISAVCEEIASVHSRGYQIGLVIGAGNICRGRSMVCDALDQVEADYMGMIATIINTIALKNFLSQIGIPTEIHSALAIEGIVDKYHRAKALQQMEQGSVLIFAGGTGHALCTTDTAAVLRAIEIKCDVVLKGTHVDGVYSNDPTKNNSSKKYHKITHNEVIAQKLKVMDLTAISLAMNSKMPIIVFDIKKSGGILRILDGRGEFSLIES
jgi:uridylate kinase